MIVTTEIGPRIIGIFYRDSENLAYVDGKTAGNTDNSDQWFLYGGHRLWHAPEDKVRTYVPDNIPVEVKESDKGVVFSSGTEAGTGIYKSIEIQALKSGKFKLIHTLRNENLWDIELAAWALTVMAPGGVGIFPLTEGDKTSLLPNRYISVWSYTSMADSRLEWGDGYILLRQDVKVETPCKIGFNCEKGWIAYLNQGYGLKKSFIHLADAEYPDNGCSIESYTCDSMLEIETLSPMHILAPQEEIVHIEEWSGFKSEEKLDNKESVERVITALGK